MHGESTTPPALPRARQFPHSHTTASILCRRPSLFAVPVSSNPSYRACLCSVCSLIHRSTSSSRSCVLREVSTICCVGRRTSMAFPKHSLWNSSLTLVSTVYLLLNCLPLLGDPMLTDRCPVLSCPVLSVYLSTTLVYCGQTVGWIKMKLGMEVGLVPGHIVLDGDPPPQKGHSPQFSAYVCCGQTAGWIKMPHGMEVGLGPGDFVSDGDPAPDPTKKGHSPPQFSAHVYCGQTAGWIKMPLGTEVSLGPGNIVLDGNPAPPSLPKRGTAPHFSAHVCCGETVAHLSYC